MFKQVIIKLLSILLILPSFSFPQNITTSISGFVTDAVTGEALIGTNILIYKDTIDISNPPFSGTATNSYGFFVFPNLTKGNYFQIIRHIGYKTIIKEILLDGKRDQIVINIKIQNEEVKLE